MVRRIPNYLFEMANMGGKYVKNPGKLDFSFYFSTEDAVESKELVQFRIL